MARFHPDSAVDDDNEPSTVCSIETFAHRWSDAQCLSIATLAACAITGLESSQQVDTLPWKHTFLRSMFQHLGIESRDEQEMLLALQENGTYQDCDYHVLAQPLLPSLHSGSDLATMTTGEHWIDTPQHHPYSASSSPPPSPDYDIRTEIINDLLYIGLGFEPSPKSKNNKARLRALSLKSESSSGEPGSDQMTTACSVSANSHTAHPNHDHPFGPSSPASSTSSHSRKKRTARFQPLEYDSRARATVFAMCNYLSLSYDTFVTIEKQISQHLYFYQQELIETEKAEMSTMAELERQEREMEDLWNEQRQQTIQQHQQQQHQEQRAQGGFARFLQGCRTGDFGFGRTSPPPSSNHTATGKSNVSSVHGSAMQTQAQSSMQELEKKKRTWKYVATGLSIAAGATVIGLTGGLAAPLVVAGATIVIGSGAAVLGTTAGIAVMTSLFGLAGGGLAGYKMHRRNRDLKELTFVPIVKDPTLPMIPSLHLAVVISGYLFDVNDITGAWQGTVEHTLENIDVYHLTFEPAELVALGNAVKSFLATEAVRMVSAQVLSQTVFAALASALILPMGLMRAGDLIDNPWAVAMDRARKAGYVMADILCERVQGARPTTLIGYSTGAIVIWECLLELAKRKEHGLVSSVVLLGAPIKTDLTSKWFEASSVVSHRFINGYSKKDIVLGTIFRLHSLGLEVAGLQAVEAVPRIENVDLTDIIGGHLEYQENMDLIISLLGVL